MFFLRILPIFNKPVTLDGHINSNDEDGLQWGFTISIEHDRHDAPD